MTGRTIPLPPNDTRVDLHERIRKDIGDKQPHFHLTGDTRLATTAASPFSVEILTIDAKNAPKDIDAWAKARLARSSA